MTPAHPTHDATPTEPANPLPTPPAAESSIPTTQQSVGDGTGSADAQPHCTPDQIANGTCNQG